jgi:hypothetical protein
MNGRVVTPRVPSAVILQRLAIAGLAASMNRVIGTLVRVAV